MVDQLDQQRVESLGPAEQIIQTLLRYTDHMVHNRPGVVLPETSSVIGIRWVPVTHREEDGVRKVYRLDKQGKKTVRTAIGTLGGDNKVMHQDRVIGEYRKPGLYPEVATWLYRQVAEVYQRDQAFVAHWASWAFTQEHRDMKVVLAAFLLVQPRSGEPVRQDGEVLFHDDDFRAVGEAMCLLRRKDGRDLHPKLLLRVGDLLALEGIAAINRELGFGKSARNPAMGRYTKAVQKWLRHRETNRAMLESLVKAGFRTTVIKLARRVGYKPESSRFFEILRWKQKQAVDGRRQIAVGAEVAAAESWSGLTEAQICQRIVDTGPNYKRIVGLIPTEIGLTRAIVAAAVEAGSLSDTDLVILTPTLEDLGLLDVPAIGERWMAASEAAENQRAANIAQRVRHAGTAEVLERAADKALQKAVEESLSGLRVYCMVDVSASMYQAIEKAKAYLSKFLQGFPLDKLHVCVFNTVGREVTIRHPSAAGVNHAFSAFTAGGGTDYGAALRSLAHHRPEADEDSLFLFVGDQQASDFTRAVRDSELNPVAFGFLYVPGNMGDHAKAVENTAAELGIPCFGIDEAIFADPYAVTRTLRRLIASTPVATGAPHRQSLVEVILKTKLLQKPVWA
ncbi:MAG: VWA domain-containing protein [Proteobacteria bacterium]|jgi:hypothetical protein|nr:VWA domain-containing protein [Pseudomonadota bacterium]